MVGDDTVKSPRTSNVDVGEIVLMPTRCPTTRNTVVSIPLMLVDKSIPLFAAELYSVTASVAFEILKSPVIPKDIPLLFKTCI